DRVQREIPESDASAVLRGRCNAHQLECDRSQQQSAHLKAPYSRKRRSRLRVRWKFLVASSPTGAINRAEARSAPRKSAPVTVTAISFAPASCAPLSEALLRSACASEANSRSTRERSALRRLARSRLLDLSIARIIPIDWFFMSAPRLAPARTAPTRLE